MVLNRFKPDKLRKGAEKVIDTHNAIRYFRIRSGVSRKYGQVLEPAVIYRTAKVQGSI